jgi:hypothetical protein
MPINPFDAKNYINDLQNRTFSMTGLGMTPADSKYLSPLDKRND